MRPLPGPIASQIWQLAAEQHGVVSRFQLLELGMHHRAIDRRILSRRLHVVFPGVYAVGRPDLTRHGWWMAAVLSCGPGAVLSHSSAAALLAIETEIPGTIEISVPGTSLPLRPGIKARRIGREDDEVIVKDGIPVARGEATIVDLALSLPVWRLERAINAADKEKLCTPDDLRAFVAAHPGRAGTAKVRKVLDRRTFKLTDSELERRFLPIARQAGLRDLETQQWVNGFRVDFFCRRLGLVIETDGLTYHRTPAEQARDRLRDQAHLTAGMTPLRFTHAQVRYEPDHVERTIRRVTQRLQARLSN